MIYALIGGDRSLAIPDSKGVCPVCGDGVISKCGDIKVWHWAHKAGFDCDDFKEGESLWHRSWKELFPERNREVIVRRGGDIHFADVKTDYQLVIELQNSSINFEKIIEREKYYDYMIWVFNCQKSLSRIEMEGEFLTWWNPRRDFSYCRKRVYLDLGEGLFRVYDIDKDKDGDIPVYGVYGEFFDKGEFLRRGMEPPEDLGLWCPGFSPIRKVPYGVCQRLRSENVPNCKDCNQYLYPYEHLCRFDCIKCGNESRNLLSGKCCQCW